MKTKNQFVKNVWSRILNIFKKHALPEKEGRQSQSQEPAQEKEQDIDAELKEM
jgi:hypothetical protein